MQTTTSMFAIKLLCRADFALNFDSYDRKEQQRLQRMFFTETLNFWGTVLKIHAWH